MRGIGLMSGTSLDGIDAALVEINGSGLTTNVTLLDMVTVPLDAELKDQIKLACDPVKSNVPLICQLNVRLGHAFLAACRRLCEEANVPVDSIDFVASHGQTIWHAPSDDPLTNSTLQIGEPSIIAYGLKTTVIADFRVMDMAAGGQGAPLVPFTEYLLYQSQHKHRLLQNIGGIGNVTVLPKAGDFKDLFAFDTGPGNMIIDEMMTSLFDQPYDAYGRTAERGKIIPKLQQELRNHPFLTFSPPKSTGREVYGKQFTQRLLADYANEKAEDLIATVTDFTAYSITDSYRKFVFPTIGLSDIEIILSGGGAHNQSLIRMIKDYLPQGLTVQTQSEVGGSNDAKEAIAFAILGNETLHGHMNNAPAATGASQGVILGKIIPNPWEHKSYYI